MNAETVPGDYFEGKESTLHSSPDHRKEMVYLIDILCQKKEYRDETNFVAVNIADRYLAALADRGDQAPSHVLVGLTATLLAAKLNESIMPCYDLTALLLPEFL